jgi:hypothetical protein
MREPAAANLIRHHMRASRAAVLLATALCACGSAGFSGGGGEPTYQIGGNLTGLDGSVVLQNNARNSLTLSSPGPFTFTQELKTGSPYNVTVSTPPAGQSCVVNGGSGTVASADVTSVAVNCTHNASNATLTGSYGMIFHQIATAIGELLAVDLDGIGSYSGTVIVNSSGTIVQGPVPSTSYTVAPDGTIPSDGVIAGGVIGKDGRAFVVGQVSPNKAPDLTVGLKAGAGLSVASLSGTFTAVGLGVTATATEADLATLTFDATGSYTGTQTANISGVITENIALSGSATVASDGSLTANGGKYLGRLSADGDLIVLGDFLPGDPPYVAVAVRRGSGTNASTLNGTYTAVVYLGDMAGGPGGSEGTVAHLVFDGKGNYAGTTTDNTAGTISSGTASGTYSVQADGSVSVVSGAQTYRGAVSTDGDVVVLADITANDNPAIAVAVRQ